MRTIPKRPSRCDVELEAVERFLSLEDIDWDAETIADQSTHDGFQLMLALHRSALWDFEREDLDTLDDLACAIDDALLDAESAWEEKFDVSSKALPAGTEIMQGVIAGVCDRRPARYLVKHPKLKLGSYLILKFEDATLV